MVIEKKPYRELVFATGEKLRIFDDSILDSELVWHRDKRDRKVTVIESGDWKFQMDDQEPVILKQGDVFRIPKMVYHRIIKGENDLVLRIKEL